MCAGAVVPFIGAGISKAATRRGQSFLPADWELISGLLEELASRSTDEDVPRRALRLLEDGPGARRAAVRFLRRQLGDDLGVRVRRQLEVLSFEPSQHQVILGLLGFELLVTTNYDTLLEDSLVPRPEVTTLRLGRDIETVVAEIEGGRARRPLLLKLNGCITQPSTIALGLGVSYYSDEAKNAFERILSFRGGASLLFMGYSFGDPDFLQLLAEVGTASPRGHYALLPRAEAAEVASTGVLDGLPITPVGYELQRPFADEHRVLWQFLTQIPRRMELDRALGAESGVFYRPAERPLYLRTQRELEAAATGFRYFTRSPTNAVATEDYLEEHCRRRLGGTLGAAAPARPDDRSAWTDAVLAAMKERAETLRSKWQEGAELRILCQAEHVRRDAREPTDAVLDRYRLLVKLMGDPARHVRVRLLDVPVTREDLRSYALISQPHATGTDLIVAFATQADQGDFVAHVIQKNTPFVRSALVSFEVEWERAETEAASRRLLRRLFDL